MLKIIRLFIALSVLFVALAIYPSYLIINSQSNDSTIRSPLPDFLTRTLPDVLGLSNYWKPNVSLGARASIETPKLMARGVISYDLTTDTLLFDKNLKVKMPMASLTKIMTAIVALETMELEKEFKVSKKAAEIGENSMGLSEGEILTLEELLYGLVLNSGNDAAEVLAEGSPFGRDNFLYLMNKKAEDLGLSDTRFTNPSGLQGDGAQYSTPYDLLVITRYALENPTFKKIVATVNYDLQANGKHKAYYLSNETNLLTTYRGVKGVKTGYTYEAGLCLISYLEYEGHEIIAVILNAQNRREEMRSLLDYSLKTLGIEPPLRI